MSFVNTVDVIGDEALASSIIDRSIETIVDDSVLTIGYYSFRLCNALKTAVFRSATLVREGAFQSCTALNTLDFHVCSEFRSEALNGCSALTALILRGNSVCKASATWLFDGSGVASGKCYIYVPASLVDSYKSADGWSAYANQFRAIEDYPEICGGVTT